MERVGLPRCFDGIPLLAVIKGISYSHVFHNNHKTKTSMGATTDAGYRLLGMTLFLIR